MILKAIIETYRWYLSMLIGTIIGFPIGIVLSVSKKDAIYENREVNKFLDIILIVNITRSIPFVILIVLLISLSRLIVGKSYGTTAFIIPLIIGIAPFYIKNY